MKKYALSLLCIAALSHGMEQEIPTTLTRHEWNAFDYDKGCRVQTEAFDKFFNIDVKKQKVLHIGSGTGRISCKLAAKAAWVDGIDPSQNMTAHAARLHKDIPNLRFFDAFAETFTPPNDAQDYDIAIAFSFHWFQRKQCALNNIARHLKKGGDFFFTAATSDNPEPLNLVVAKDMMTLGMGSLLDAAKNYFSTNQTQALGSSYPSLQELTTMLEKADFDIITCEEKSCSVILENRQEVEDFQRPIVMSRPLVHYVPLMIQQYLFSEFIDRILKHMEKTADGKFIEKITTTVVHARKK